jgi:hypothetical protein
MTEFLQVFLSQILRGYPVGETIACVSSKVDFMETRNLNKTLISQKIKKTKEREYVLIILILL